MACGGAMVLATVTHSPKEALWPLEDVPGQRCPCCAAPPQ